MTLVCPVPGKCLDEETESSCCLSEWLTPSLISANSAARGEDTTLLSALHLKGTKRTGVTQRNCY